MSVLDWWTRARWRFYAPVYDLAMKPFEHGRATAIEALDLEAGDRVLIVACGTGRDLAHLPPDVDVTGIDLTPAMVRRTEARAERLGLDVDVHVGDAQDLPFDDGAFDAVLLHLVLTVVPDPGEVLAEADRVLAPDGRVSIFDKFVPAGSAPGVLRRVLDPIARVLFSALTRRLDPLLADTELDITAQSWHLGGLYTVAIARRPE